MVRIYAFQVWFALCISYSLYRGGGAERTAALLQLAAEIASLGIVNGFAFAHSYQAVRPGLWLVDTALLIGLYVVTLNSTRFWPLWLTGLQVVGVAGHLLRVIDPQMMAHGYQTIVNGVAWPMLGITAAGTYRHQRRLRRYGTDNSWLISSHRSRLIARVDGLMR